MGFESFYGGRQGAAFVVVKQFDGIDIPANTLYKPKYLAVTNDEQYFIYDNGFIERNSENYNNYIWRFQDCDGELHSVQFPNGDISQIEIPVQYQEGMKQCFEKGGDTTDVVNYNEYVIIDTPSKDNPDNGKVFRRGMNFNDEKLAGAEYIGQIVGPQGESPELNFDHYDIIEENYSLSAIKKEYAPFDDIIPGSYLDGNERKYNDEIKYIYVTIKDNYNNIKGCLVGFKLPNLILEIVGESISPYDNRTDTTTPEGKTIIEYTDLMVPDPDEYDEDSGKWTHPFFEKWQLKIPYGIHGIDSTNIEKVHTLTMPEGFKSNDFLGAQLYNEISCLEEDAYIVDDNPVYLATSTPVLQDEQYDANPDVVGCAVMYEGVIKYVKKEECYMDFFRYKETDYLNSEEGEVTYINIGRCNDINRICLTENGKLLVYYNAQLNPQNLEEVIRWIDTEDTQGITINDQGTVTIYFNNLIENPTTHQMEHEKKVYPKVLDWITDISLSQEGKFKVIFNNDTYFENKQYTAQLKWIDLIEINPDGVVDFYWNNDHNNAAYQSLTKFKIIQKTEVETDGLDPYYPDSTKKYEGFGNQKLHIFYNTKDDTTDDQEVDIIDNPLNYIVEQTICVKSANYPDVPDYHLLVYYSDPALRDLLGVPIKNSEGQVIGHEKWYTYPSSKIIDGINSVTNEPIYHIWHEWIDLGPVRGQTGGFRNIKNISSLNELRVGGTASGAWIPPEELTNSSGYPIVGQEGKGWGVTLTSGGNTTIYFYDYDKKEWYPVGSFNGALLNNKMIIDKTEPSNNLTPKDGEATDLAVNGIWFAKEKGYCVQ